MFKIHNLKINSYAQRNAENMADVIMMVSVSIQQRWSQVGKMLSSVRLHKDNSLFLWGNKKRTYEYVTTHKHFIHGSMLAVINSSNLTDHAKAISLMKIFLKIPGLNLAKAGFVCQLSAGLVGCMDIHNIKTYGVAAKSLEYNKKCKTSKGFETNRKKLTTYIELCNNYGTENLWNSWCAMLATKYPKDFVDSNHVSELHYTYLTGE